ncbi:MAG: HEAT repeat domain-containing protein, partial [Planctomycetota bacterium]|nr:HEAT repeat domain-containing protein [Planctomycetota bacterium]
AGARQIVSLVSQPEKRALVQRVLEKRRSRLLPELRQLVRTSNDRVASEAARALGLARDRESLKLLASLARKKDTAEGATEALLGIGTPAAYQAAFVAASWGGAPSAAAHCFDDDNRAEPFLLGVLESGTLKERRAALRLLERCGGDQTAAFLARGQFGRSLLPHVAGTLTAIGSDAAVKALAALGHRREVLGALARIHTPESARVLVDLLEEPRARRDAGRALATMPTGVVVPVLLESFERDPRRVRRVLTRIAGDNLGTGVEPWKKWWDERP